MCTTTSGSYRAICVLSHHILCCDFSFLAEACCFLQSLEIYFNNQLCTNVGTVSHSSEVSSLRLPPKCSVKSSAYVAPMNFQQSEFYLSLVENILRQHCSAVKVNPKQSKFKLIILSCAHFM